MTGAILAGGRSRRLQGPDKTRLLWRGERVIQRQAKLLRLCCERVVVVARQEQLEALDDLPVDEVLADLFEGCGPLGGLYTALEDTEDEIFLLACDMPFITPELVHGLHAAFDQGGAGFGVVTRTIDEQGLAQVEPLCSIWSHHARRPAYVALESGERSVRAFADQLGVRYVDVPFSSADRLRSINTVNELQEHGEDLGFSGEN
ncbi:MAG: molybdenum cofactor guanylyltransferase [Planctomycetota bacterium]|nr:molybdenum cofactor guanylyltransferase [Planctomycetota bacterium]